MAEAIEDDWDFSSPPGSPSSPLPQSIRKVLDSVRAEFGIEDSGVLCSSFESPTIVWSNQLSEAPFFGGQKAVDMNGIQCTLGMSHGPTKVDIDTDQELSQTQSHHSLLNPIHSRNATGQQDKLDQETEAPDCIKAQKRVQKQNKFQECIKSERCVSQVQQSLLSRPEELKQTYNPANVKRWIKIDTYMKVESQTVEPTFVNNKTTLMEKKNSEYSPVTGACGNSPLKTTPENRTYIMNPMRDNNSISNIGEENMHSIKNIFGKKETVDESEKGQCTTKPKIQRGANIADLPDSLKNPKSAGVDRNIELNAIGVEDRRCFSVSRLSAGENGVLEEKLGELDSSQENSITTESMASIEADELETLCFTDDQESKGIPRINNRYHEHKLKCKVSQKWENNDLPLTEHKKIKLDKYSDNEWPVNKDVNRIDECKLDQAVQINPAAIWKKELLSSDFNLMYGNLRAVLMGTISKSERSRLIHTMIATMNEIKQVSMEEGNPTLQSVRCGTPEMNDSGIQENLLVSSKNKETAIMYLGKHGKYENIGEKRKQDREEAGKVSFQQKGFVMKKERAKSLMKENPDGTKTCRVCNMVREATTRGLCRACVSFVNRIQKGHSIGNPLPTCAHDDYSGVGCRSCRYWKLKSLTGMA